MDWFNGRLEVTFTSGNSTVLNDVSFKKAQEYLDKQTTPILSALYYPSTCSMI